MQAKRIVLFVVSFIISLFSFAQGEDLKPFKSKDNGKWGYKDAKGAIFIEPQYDDAKTFSEGVAVVKSGEKYGMINLQGEYVIKPEYEFGIAYHNGYYILNHEIIDKSGKRVEAYGMKSYNGESNFNSLYWLKGSNAVVFKKNRRCIMMHLDGKVIKQFGLGIHFGSYEFNNGLCCIYKNLKRFGGNGLNWLERYEKSCSYGYIDTTGRIVLRPQFRYAYDFSEGMASVANCIYKRGYIDTNGKWVIKPQYDYASDFCNGMAFVFKKGSFVGFIDYKGNCVLDLTSSASFEDYLKGCKLGLIPSFIPSVTSKRLESGEVVIHGGYRDNPKCVVDEKGDVSYFINVYDEIVDKDGNLIEKPNIQWSNNLAITDQPQYVMTATINSGSKINYCKVFLNNVEIRESNAPGGSSIVEEQKGGNNISISRTLFLFEGTNTIKIEAKNAGGITTDERKIVYTPKKQEPVAVAKVLIEWGDLPTITTNPRLELDAMVRSTVSDVSCRVLLNGAEAPKTKGSFIVEDPKESEYKCKLDVKSMLTLNVGANAIAIEVRDAKGKLLAAGEKHVIYTKPALATIVWENMPTTTEEKQFTLKAEIKSESEVEYCHVTFNGSRTKGSQIVRDNYNVTLNETFNLREGENFIKIEVKNKGGEVVAEKKVTYNPKEKRIALVIGNADYKNLRFPKLNKTKADAQAMYTLLESYGFDMRPLVLDANLKKMREAVNDFVDEVGRGNYDVALLYFSGHGLSPDGGANYLIPIDASINYTDEVKYNAINSKTEVLAKLEEMDCRVEILLLDCCNDCTLTERGTKGAYNGGLSPIRPSYGISVIHAALPGKKALEGAGKNSPFVESFVECSNSHPNVGWESFVNDFIESVNIKTNGYQTPYAEGRILGKPFYINANH